MPNICLFYNADGKLLGHCHRDKFPEDLPDSVVVAGRVFLALDESPLSEEEDARIRALGGPLAFAFLPVAIHFVEISALNLDIIRKEKRAENAIIWQPGCAPIEFAKGEVHWTYKTEPAPEPENMACVICQKPILRGQTYVPQKEGPTCTSCFDSALSKTIAKT